MAMFQTNRSFRLWYSDRIKENLVILQQLLILLVNSNRWYWPTAPWYKTGLGPLCYNEEAVEQTLSIQKILTFILNSQAMEKTL